jgi:hypothetical protein
VKHAGGNLGAIEYGTSAFDIDADPRTIRERYYGEAISM